MFAGYSAAIVSICFTHGLMPMFWRVTRTASSVAPVADPICASENPTCLAFSIADADSCGNCVESSPVRTALIFSSLRRNHSSIFVSSWSFSTLYPSANACANACTRTSVVVWQSRSRTVGSSPGEPAKAVEPLAPPWTTPASSMVS